MTRDRVDDPTLEGTMARFRALKPATTTGPTTRERMLASGWDLSEEALMRAEILIADGEPLSSYQAKELAKFLDCAIPESHGKRALRMASRT